MAAVRNVHRVKLAAAPEQVGRLLDALGSDRDGIWPGAPWPPMRMAGPLAVGVHGAHGTVSYVVAEYVPGVRVQFRFLAPAGLVGTHAFEVVPEGTGACLEHRMDAQAQRGMAVVWPLLLGPLHDALAEDAGARAAATLGELRSPPVRSRYVRALFALARWLGAPR